MTINASITSIREQAGVRGDGEIILGDNILRVRIPCLLKDPSTFRVAQDADRGLGTTHVLVVGDLALRGHMGDPHRLVGARVEYHRHSVRISNYTQDITAVRELADGGMIELTMGKRVDGAVMGGAS